MIAVKQSWVFKVANYGQWDWYPTGQGASIRTFLSEVDMDIFKEKISACRPISREELTSIPNIDENWVTWSQTYPWLSRDAWADILKYIMEDKSVLRMTDNCLIPDMWIEWSYLIDLDKMTLSVYKWTILSDDKYANAPDWPCDISKVYKERKPMHSYKLDKLPTKDEWAKKYKNY